MEETIQEGALFEQVLTGADVIHQAPLTSAETAHLWETYLHYSMLVCVQQHFIRNVDDVSARLLVEEGFNIAETRAKIGLGHPCW